jgi:hypothetical protein
VRSLSDAELAEDVIQLIFICDLTRDLAEIMKALPDVGCNQVAEQFFIKPLLYIMQ